MTGIEWCDETWNPVTGCTKISPGCKHCYAERVAKRFFAKKGGFELQLYHDRLNKSWGKKPKRIFVGSMTDIFHAGIPDDFRDKIFDVMRRNPQHTFLLLTKRSIMMRHYITERYGWRNLLPNVWLGVSCETSEYLPRLYHLIITPAIRRFVSFEPLLGPIESIPAQLLLNEIDWAIVGGESGPKHRPIQDSWVYGIKRMCHNKPVQAHARIPRTAFFFKQWGGKTSKAGGRLFDGKVWDELPEGDVRATHQKPPGWPVSFNPEDYMIPSKSVKLTYPDCLVK